MINSDRLEPAIGETHLDDGSGPSPTLPGQKTYRRRPWLALLLGLLVGPLSWIYVGHYEIGILFYLLQLGLLAALGLTGLAQSVAGVWFIAFFGLVATLIGIIGPWLIARRVKDRFVPRWYNRWYWYPVLWLIVVVPFGYAAFNKATLFGVGTYRVPSGSMEPTIAVGDFIVADTRSDIINRLSRGDIVVHYAKREPKLLFVRRVVGLPGEHVVVTADAIEIDGRALPQGSMGSNFLADNWMHYRDVKLGPSEYFLLGDNRSNSIDSRTEGSYSRDSIVGVVTARWYSAKGKPLEYFAKSTP